MSEFQRFWVVAGVVTWFFLMATGFFRQVTVSRVLFALLCCLVWPITICAITINVVTKRMAAPIIPEPRRAPLVERMVVFSDGAHTFMKLPSDIDLVHPWAVTDINIIEIRTTDDKPIWQRMPSGGFIRWTYHD